MAEYDGNNWVTGGAQLVSPFHVRVLPQAADVSDGTPTVLATGSGSQNLTVEFDQALHYVDPALGDGHHYRINITFNGYVAQ
jgi:hypothetical protein